jgi:hypothetical protein
LKSTEATLATDPLPIHRGFPHLTAENDAIVLDDEVHRGWLHPWYHRIDDVCVLELGNVHRYPHAGHHRPGSLTP